MDGKRKKIYVERVVNDIMDELDQGTTEQEICQGGMDCDNYPEEWEEVVVLVAAGRAQDYMGAVVMSPKKQCKI